MATGWEESWRRIGAASVSGGQGDSFIASDKGDDSKNVFIKALKFQKSTRARKRFLREVTAYQTLAGLPGLPVMIDNNAQHWQDKQVHLYMVLELIDGPTLGQKVKADGPLDIAGALACISIVAETVSKCHDEGVVHRDLKPDNLILRSGSPGDPVVVDFGLSFNQTDSIGEVTRIGEEVGNRFLRLPEHSLGGRSPVSDVTQVAALLLYALTASAPRSLIDEQGLPPHYRQDVRDCLGRLLSGRQLLRLDSLFDRAFTPMMSARYQSMAEFIADLHGVMATDAPALDRDSLLSHVREYVNQPSRASARNVASELTRYVHMSTEVVRKLASAEGLTVTQSAFTVNQEATPPSVSTKLGLGFPSGRPPTLVEFRFEMRAPAFTCLIDGEVVWRGGSIDDGALRAVIEQRALMRFLRDQETD